MDAWILKEVKQPHRRYRDFRSLITVHLFFIALTYSKEIPVNKLTMKKVTLGIFTSRENAESTIYTLQKDLGISADDISYVYRNTENEVKEVEVDEVQSDGAGTAAANTTGGAITGGLVGALAGLATAVGVIPVIGPIFAAGPLLAALGLTVGAVGSAATTGAITGGLIGALTSLGFNETKAKEYEDRVFAGDILVAVHSEDAQAVEAVLMDAGAISIETYTPAV